MEQFTFNEETHEYKWGDKILPSVTTILEKTLFENKYEDIDEMVLKKAAEKGSMIHAEIENYIKNNELGFSSELYNFIQIKENHNLENIQSEVKVHDENIAGTIDIIADKISNSNKKKKILADIKTTYKLDTTYVSWQLSFYAYILEHAYKEKIDELYAIWLRDDNHRFVKVERKTDKEIEDVLEAFKNGSKIDLTINTLQTIPKDKQIAFCGILKQIKAMEEKTKEIKESILKEMEARGIENAVIGDVKISYKRPSIKTSVDTKKLKEDGLYEKYSKISAVKSSITIKLGKEEN